MNTIILLATILTILTFLAHIFIADQELKIIQRKSFTTHFELVDKNRIHLREWFPFVDIIQTVQFAENFALLNQYKI